MCIDNHLLCSPVYQQIIMVHRLGSGHIPHVPTKPFQGQLQEVVPSEMVFYSHDMNASSNVVQFICMYVCMYVCMHVCMYVFIHLYTYSSTINYPWLSFQVAIIHQLLIYSCWNHSILLLWGPYKYETIMKYAMKSLHSSFKSSVVLFFSWRIPIFIPMFNPHFRPWDHQFAEIPWYFTRMFWYFSPGPGSLHRFSLQVCPVVGEGTGAAVLEVKSMVNCWRLGRLGVWNHPKKKWGES